MKIVTVTPNTAIDRLVTVRRGVASQGHCWPAGKGINVARTVTALGCPVIALGFVGEAEQELFTGVAGPSLSVKLIAVAGATRTNTTTFYADRQETEHQRTQGFMVGMKDWERLGELLGSTIEAGDTVIFSGSAPAGSDADAYGRLIRLCHERQVRSVLDSSGIHLREGIKAIPFMVKPNLEELAELQAGEKGPAIAARQLQQTGIGWVIVSRGAEGIVAVTEDGGWQGGVELDRAPSETGSVGSGDALVGGIAVGWMRELSVEAALRLGIACGAANVLRAGPGVCDIADVERLSAAVVLRRMEAIAG
jgi:1-phosphofructokinase family hexose kinase